METEPAAVQTSEPPLVVDLDGTLIAVDTLAEAFLLLARKHPLALLQHGAECEAAGDVSAAATAYDRAFSLAPSDEQIASTRKRLLDRLQVVEHGLTFRFIPAGHFPMGSELGDSVAGAGVRTPDPDESPIHWVHLDAFWISETPISWASYCRFRNWMPPPEGGPPESYPDVAVAAGNRVRLQYCEDYTLRAMDWHAHVAPDRVIEHFKKSGLPPRSEPDRAYGYSEKAMVAVTWDIASQVCALISTDTVTYRLPTEAEWEKSARGGLAGSRYAWGDEDPNRDRCDFDRFEELSILPMRRFPPNGYGLYAMCGGVWEWVNDWYDGEYYQISPDRNPKGPSEGEQRVLRGGSWTDTAATVTASFRMSHPEGFWTSVNKAHQAYPAANIGFRICRVARVPGT